MEVDQIVIVVVGILGMGGKVMVVGMERYCYFLVVGGVNCTLSLGGEGMVVWGWERWAIGNLLGILGRRMVVDLLVVDVGAVIGGASEGIDACMDFVALVFLLLQDLAHEPSIRDTFLLLE